MMRRRRYQADPRSSMTSVSYLLTYFVPRKMSSLSGLCPLGHFYLQLIRIGQIFNSNTEPTLGNLLYLASSLVLKSFSLFPSLASVRKSPQLIHGNSQCFMGFP